MGLSVATVRVACNTSTGTQDITISGFGTPKAARLIAVRANTDGVASDGMALSYGFTDGTRQYAVGVDAQDAVGSTNVYHLKSTSFCVVIPAAAGSGSIDGEASFSAWITDGIRINWPSNAPDAGYFLIVELFGGTDLSVHSNEKDLGTGTSAIDITDPGFEPDVVFALLAPAASASEANVSYGFIHNNRAGTITQKSVSYRKRDNVATVLDYMQINESKCLSQLGNVGETGNLVASDFDSSGFSVTPSASLGGKELFYLALRFGSSPVVNAKVYTYTSPTGTGSNTDNNPNFTPQWVTYITSPMTAVDTFASTAVAGGIGFCSLDATRQYHSLVTDERGATDSNTKSFSDDQAIHQLDYQGTDLAVATLSSMGTTGPVFSYSTAPATALKFIALAIQAETTTTSLVFPRKISTLRRM